MIIGRNVFDKICGNDIKIYEIVRKASAGQGDNCAIDVY